MMLSKMDNCPVTLLIARFLLGLIYVLGGTALFTGGLPIDFAASKGIPEILVWLAFVVKFVGGLAVIIGYQTRIAALALVVFTVLTAFIFHSFLGGVFLKEMAMIGGLLVLATTGAGKFSIDEYKNKDKATS